MKTTSFLLASTLALSLSACTSESAESESTGAETAVQGSSSDEVANTDTEASQASASSTSTEPATEATSQPTSQPTSDSAAATAGEVRHIGGEFTLDSDPISLAEAIATCADGEQTCKVKGTIEQVCQVRGCWFTLTAPDVSQTVRVRMQDYAFFAPRDSVGHEVIFEGRLTRTQISQEMAQHYADDEAAAGGERRVVSGPEDTYQFMIVAADILPL